MKLIAASFVFVIVCAFVLRAQEPARPFGIPGVYVMRTDDPRKFNWDKPDLITWSVNDNPYRDDTMIDDGARIVYRSREWACRVTPTTRKTWASDGKRSYEESRGIECTLPTRQTAAVFARCVYTPGQFLSDEVSQYIGDSATTDLEYMRWLYLRCFVGADVPGPLKITHE